jgi:oxygen-dependent protoporphyrinogen oxidase
MNEVRVIGAGLSGLTTAWYLAQAGARVRVIEAAGRPGGLIQTRRVPEGLVEAAARAFTWSPRASAIFEGANVRPCFAHEQSRRRYIFRDGRAKRWPLTPAETAGAAARFGCAWLGRQVRPRPGETVAAWGTRVVGPAAVTWLVAPALQGIYASPPDALSASALFGKKRPRGGKLAAPPEGMGELIDQLHDALVARGVSFEFGTPVSQLDPSRPTAICTNAPAAARLLAPHAPDLAAALRRIRMVSLVTATVFFQPHEHDLRGFGVLFPRSAGIAALGALFNAEIFPGRSALRSETWIYGDLLPAALPRTDAAVIGRVTADRSVLTGRTDAPTAFYVTPQIEALPVYDTAVLDAEAALGQLPHHVAIAGNYLGRLGVSSLLDGAAAAAARLVPEGVAA